MGRLYGTFSLRIFPVLPHWAKLGRPFETWNIPQNDRVILVFPCLLLARNY
jgi:hypothetical protein